jgi:hypothetical protein
MSGVAIDLTGQKFGRLTVLSRGLGKLLSKTGKKSHTGAWWLCLCSCGTEKTISRGNLVSGGTTSCGCLHREELSARNKQRLTAGPWEADMRLYLRKLNSRAKRLKSKLGSNQFHTETGASKKILWALSLDQYIILVSGDCFYCGQSPSGRPAGVAMGYGDYMRSGIDRVNNELGYEVSNCVSCCVTCNRDKRGATQSDFIAHTRKRYDWLLQKGLLTR